MNDRYMTVTEVADYLRVSYDTALNLMKYSEMECIQIGRQYRVLKSKLDEFLYPPEKPKIKMMHRPVYQIIERK